MKSLLSLFVANSQVNEQPAPPAGPDHPVNERPLPPVEAYDGVAVVLREALFCEPVDHLLDDVAGGGVGGAVLERHAVAVSSLAHSSSGLEIY